MSGKDIQDGLAAFGRKLDGIEKALSALRREAQEAHLETQAVRRKENALTLLARFDAAQHEDSGALRTFLNESVEARRDARKLAGDVMSRAGFIIHFDGAAKQGSGRFKTAEEAAILIERVLPHVAVEHGGSHERVRVAGTDAPIIRRIVVGELNRLDECFAAAAMGVADAVLVHQQLDPYLDGPAGPVWKAVAMELGGKELEYVCATYVRLAETRSTR